MIIDRANISIPFWCPNCNAEFSVRYTEHVRHQDRPWLCGRCGTTFFLQCEVIAGKPHGIRTIHTRRN